MREFLSSLNDEDLGRVIEFSVDKGPKSVMRLGELMHHAAVHGIHHRGQLAVYLRPMGAKVPSIYGESYDTAQAKIAR